LVSHNSTQNDYLLLHTAAYKRLRKIRLIGTVVIVISSIMDADDLLTLFGTQSGFMMTEQKSLGQGVHGTPITMDDAGEPLMPHDDHKRA
jgi:hypothetical protein